MATKAGSIYTEIRARLEKYERDLKKAHGITTKGADKIQKRINKISFRKASQSMANFTRMFNTAAIALAGGGAIGSLIKIGTDYENSVFQMSQTFQDQTDAMIAKAKDMASQFKYFYDFNDISYAFTKTADSMERYGITGDKYINLVTRAADIGAAKNLQLKESIDRIESAMRGEAEASEYLGLTLNDTYMKNIAFEGSLKDTWETMTDMQKTQARYNELMVQSAKYHGAAEKAASQLSGAMSSLGKAIKDRLTPYLETATATMASMVTKLRDLWTAEKTFTKQAGLKAQQEALLKRQQSIQTAIQEIGKSNTPNKQDILDRMFNKLGLVQGKLEIVSGELYALEKQAENSFKKSDPITGSGADAGGGTKPSVDYSFLQKTDAAYRMSRAGGVVKQMGSIEESYRKAYEHGQKLADNAPMDSWQIKAEKNFEVVAEKAEDLFNSMLQLSERTAWAMQENFGNLFYDAMKGELNSFKDYFSAFVDSLQRGWADVMGQMATEWIFGNGFKGGGLMSDAWGFLSSIFSGFGGGTGGSATTIRRGAGGGYGFDSGGHIGERVVGMGASGKSYEFHPNEVVIPDSKFQQMGGQENPTVNNTYNVYNISAMDTESGIQYLRRIGAVPMLASENLSENGILRSAIMENV